MEKQKVRFEFVTFTGEHQEVEGMTGETVMQVAYDNGVEGVAAECGGSMSCGTCHVFLDEASFDRIDAPSEGEVDMLDIVASERRPTSRLSCQIKLEENFAGAKVMIPELQY